ncbi:hypothetical protein SADUNF_Sadunf10G0152400 [Salix dunnii]|uniref:Uncharacterized protein n=1 Tax=Salix dunnii TaxID=1413687 RepID=A0A835JQP4_9ROSI|nr:hypothetical protein SADUNF_Sadunf10G0152400 [Salix dunnii]
MLLGSSIHVAFVTSTYIQFAHKFRRSGSTTTSLTIPRHFGDQGCPVGAWFVVMLAHHSHLMGLWRHVWAHRNSRPVFRAHIPHGPPGRI